MTTRVRKQHKPGRITFVGSGPGDPGLLTTRARNVLAHAALVFTDPDVPEAVLALIGTDLPPTSGPHPADAEPAAEAATDDAAAAAPTLSSTIKGALSAFTDKARLGTELAQARADLTALMAELNELVAVIADEIDDVVLRRRIGGTRCVVENKLALFNALMRAFSISTNETMLVFLLF